MLTYTSLLEEAKKALPYFKAEYERLIMEDEIDEETGNHIIFSYAFVPQLIEAIRENDKDKKRQMLDFLELMAGTEDVLVQEVCDLSILEALNDEIDLNKIKKEVGQNTLKGIETVKQYLR